MTFSCFPSEALGSDERRKWFPCLATMAMGDNNAVELGQGAHVLLGLQAKVIDPSELLAEHLGDHWLVE